jgi:hypothetical protein
MAQTGTPSPAQVANFPASIDGSANDNTYAGSRDLLLKQFSGEVLTHFDEMFSLKDRIRVRTLNGGKSAQFPLLGQAAAEHFTPGQEIVGQPFASSEVTLTIDDFIVSSVFLNNIDEMLTHFEFRGEYSKQMAQSIALTAERTLFQMAVRDSRLGDLYNTAQVVGEATPHTAASGAGAGKVGMNNAVTKRLGTAATAADLIDEAFVAAAYFDENNLPIEGRSLYVSPRVYYDLINQTTDTRIINSDFSANGGDYANAVIFKVAGFDIVKTNHLAINGTLNTNTGPDGRTPLNAPANGFGQDYATDATSTLGMFMHTEGLGMVKLQDLTTESEYSVAKQGSLLVSKLLMGAGTLRPSALYEVNKLADAA